MRLMNWQELIKRLIDSGMTQQQIADQVGVTQSVISELSTGKATRPRFETGAALIGLANGAGADKETA